MHMHAGVQLGSITGSERYEWEGQPGVFDQPPETGTMPTELVESLASALARHTATPDQCYFAIWEGYAQALSPAIRAAPTFEVPSRRYHLLTGPVGAVREIADGALSRFRSQSPNLWWPQDRAWCVATEIDFKTTYIGADGSCVEELATLPAIEAATVAPDLGIDLFSDTVNPRQALGHR